MHCHLFREHSAEGINPYRKPACTVQYYVFILPSTLMENDLKMHRPMEKDEIQKKLWSVEIIRNFGP